MPQNIHSNHRNNTDTPPGKLFGTVRENNCSEDVAREEDECWHQTNQIHPDSGLSLI